MRQSEESKRKEGLDGLAPIRSTIYSTVQIQGADILLPYLVSEVRIPLIIINPLPPYSEKAG